MLNLLTGRSSRTKKANTRQAAANLPDNNVWLMLSHSAHIKGEILKEFHLELSDVPHTFLLQAKSIMSMITLNQLVEKHFIC